MHVGNVGNMPIVDGDLERVNYAYALSNKACASKRD
jgi:hypothetical protein